MILRGQRKRLNNETVIMESYICKGKNSVGYKDDTVVDRDEKGIAKKDKW